MPAKCKEFRQKHPIYPGVIIFLLVFFIVSALSHHLLSDGFFHMRIISYAEKARLALNGNPPRLENVGFVYPPLPVLMIVILRSLWVTQGIVAALVISFLMFMGYNLDGSDAFPLILLFLPLYYLMVLRFDKLLLFFLLAVSTYLLASYCRKDFSLYLFLGGILFGLTFFLNFTSVLLIPLYMLAIFLGDEEPSRKKGMATVFFLPIAFFFFATGFIDWVFKGDFLYFLHKRFVFYSQGLALQQAGFEFFTFLKLLIPLILPYLLGIFLLDFRDIKMLLLYLSPIFFIAVEITAGTAYPAVSDSVLFFLFFLFFLGYMKHWRLVPVAAVFTILFAPFAMRASPNLNEVNFAKFSFGEPYRKNLKRYRELANFFNSLKGKILMDDKQLYPAILFVKNIKRLVLPYQYEYYTDLSYPLGKVDYVVGVTNSRDDVYNLYPDIANYRLDGCEFLRRSGDVFIFSCKINCSYNNSFHFFR